MKGVRQECTRVCPSDHILTAPNCQIGYARRSCISAVAIDRRCASTIVSSLSPLTALPSHWFFPPTTLQPADSHARPLRVISVVTSHYHRASHHQTVSHTALPASPPSPNDSAAPSRHPHGPFHRPDRPCRRATFLCLQPCVRLSVELRGCWRRTRRACGDRSRGVELVAWDITGGGCLDEVS